MKNKKNKKWVILVDAIIAVAWILFLLVIITQLSSITTRMKEGADKVLSMWVQNQLINSIEFIKKRSLSLEKQFSRATQNEQLAWWVSAPITSDGTQSFNDLDWTYIIKSWQDCGSSYLVGLRCLEKIPDDKWWALPLRYDLNTITEDSSWDEIRTEVISGQDLTVSCEGDYSSTCLGYRLVIANQNSDRQGKWNYTLGNWRTEEIRSKTVKIEINDWRTNTRYSEFNYVLSPLLN